MTHLLTVDQVSATATGESLVVHVDDSVVGVGEVIESLDFMSCSCLSDLIRLDSARSIYCWYATIQMRRHVTHASHQITCCLRDMR